MTSLELAHAQIEQQAKDLQLYLATIQVLRERIAEVEEANQSLHVALAMYQTRHGGNDDQ